MNKNNNHKANKSFFHRKKYSLRICVMMLIGFGYPWLVMLLNPPPNQENLQIAKVKIIKIKDESPNIRAEMSTGEIQNFEFPPSGYSPFHGFPRFYIENNKKISLEGCFGYIKYDEMRFLIFRKILRAWSLNCENSFISYPDTLQKYKEDRDSMRFIENIGYLLMFSFCVYLLYFERNEE